MNKSIEKARAITGVINDLSFDAKDVAKALTYQHKTLQQGFTRLCVEWLRVCAAMDDMQIDPRNEASRAVARKLMANAEDLPALPFI